MVSSSGQDLGAAVWSLLADATNAATTLSVTGGVIIARQEQANACLLELNGGDAGQVRRVGPVEAQGLTNVLLGARLCKLTGLDQEGGALGAEGTLLLAAVLPTLSALATLNLRYIWGAVNSWFVPFHEGSTMP